MDGICKLDGSTKTLPCAAPNCPLYGDCVAEWEKITKKTVTNADRIRAMSDEELAVFLESSCGCPSDDDCEYGVHATLENCIKHWTTWLQQPAEEDT